MFKDDVLPFIYVICIWMYYIDIDFDFDFGLTSLKCSFRIECIVVYTDQTVGVK